MKFTLVRLMPWKWDGAVVVGGTPAEFRAWAKRYIDAEIDNGPNSAGHAYVYYGKPFLIWVESLKNIPALAHEAMHIAHGVLEGRGVKHNESSEEAYTYTMEDLIRQVLTAKKWRTVRARR
jgi:hypothetical protein